MSSSFHVFQASSSKPETATTPTTTTTMTAMMAPNNNEFARVNFRLECKELRQVKQNNNSNSSNNSGKKSSIQQKSHKHQKQKQIIKSNSLIVPTSNNFNKSNINCLPTINLQQEQVKLEQQHQHYTNELETLKNVQFDSMRERLFRLLSKVPIHVETIKTSTNIEAQSKLQTDLAKKKCKKTTNNNQQQQQQQQKTFEHLRQPLVIKYYQDRSLYEILELHFACSLLNANKQHNSQSAVLIDQPGEAFTTRGIDDQQQHQQYLDNQTTVEQPQHQQTFCIPNEQQNYQCTNINDQQWMTTIEMDQQQQQHQRSCWMQPLQTHESSNWNQSGSETTTTAATVDEQHIVLMSVRLSGEFKTKNKTIINLKRRRRRRRQSRCLSPSPS